MHSVFDIATYNPTPDDKFFFDNNVWMYLFCQLGNYKKSTIAPYSLFLKKILKVEGKIYTSSLVLSEFFNTYARVEFKIAKEKEPGKYKNFKKFRKTKKYKELIFDMKTIAKGQIFKLADRLDDRFESINLNRIMDRIDTCDYNDSYFMELSALNGLNIVTNDVDFFEYDMDFRVITANKKLLNKNK